MIPALLLAGCLIQTDLYEARRAQLVDADGDGFNPLEGDCDDGDAAVAPGLADIDCDGVDDDCDGAIDESGDVTLYYLDADGDGYGDTRAPITSCSRPDGYAPDEGDCDDADPAINPGAAEVCNGRDDDCDPHPLLGGALDLAPYRVHQDADATSRLGAAVAAAGDWSGDGVADIVAGAPGANAGEGLVHVWFGPVAERPSSLSSSPAAGEAGAALSGEPGALLIGAPGAGQAILSDLDLKHAVLLSGGGRVGEAVLLTAGLRSAGERDLVIPQQGEDGVWRVYVLPELTYKLDLDEEGGAVFADLLGPDPAPPGLLAADLDGDGQQDLAVGSGDLAYLFFGPLTGAVSYPPASVNGDANSGAGAAFAWAADAGVLAVGAPGDDAVYLHAGLEPGSYEDIDGDAAAILRGAAGTGAALATGDFDGDGALDLVIGAPDAGVVYLLRGPLPGDAGPPAEIDPEIEADLRLEAPKGSLAGAAVADAGDATAAGCGDILIGAPGSAAVYLVPGGE